MITDRIAVQQRLSGVAAAKRAHGDQQESRHRCPVNKTARDTYWDETR